MTKPERNPYKCVDCGTTEKPAVKGIRTLAACHSNAQHRNSKSVLLYWYAVVTC